MIRHLVMPCLQKDSIMVLDWIKANLPSAVINLMANYKPAYRTDEYKEINRQLTASEYQLVSSYFQILRQRFGMKKDNIDWLEVW